MRRIAAVLTVLLAATGMISCDNGPTAGTGKLTVALTDAPFPFDSVQSVDLHIVRVEAKQTATGDDETANPNSDGWTVIAEPNAVINLLPLNGGFSMTLGSAEIPTGTWRNFRIVIDPSDSKVLLKPSTGETTPLDVNVKWPSAAQSGIKILLDEPVVVTQGETVMLVDFDVGSSFVMRGNAIRNNGLLFKPVVHAIATDITGKFSGTVRGESTTGPVVADANVELFPAGTPITTTDAPLKSGMTLADGTFSIFVAPGTYTVRVTPPSGSIYKQTLMTPDLTVAAKQVVEGVVMLPK